MPEPEPDSGRPPTPGPTHAYEPPAPDPPPHPSDQPPRRFDPFPKMPGRSGSGLADLRGTAGALLLAGFVLAIVAGVLAVVWGLERLGVDALAVESVTMIILGLLTLGGALAIWNGQNEPAGILCIVTGVIMLAVGPENAGVLALVGGVVALVARRVPEWTAPR